MPARRYGLRKRYIQEGHRLRILFRLAIRHPLGSTIVGVLFVLFGILIAIEPLLSGSPDATSTIIGILMALIGVYLLYRGIKGLRTPKPQLQSVSYMNPTPGVQQPDSLQ